MQTPRARFTVGSLRAVFSACAAMRAARHPPPTSRNCPGQLAGAYYGAAALPQRWVERLFFRPLLLAAADALAELADGRSLRCVPRTQVVMHTTTYCGKSRKKARRRSDRSSSDRSIDSVQRFRRRCRRPATSVAIADARGGPACTFWRALVAEFVQVCPKARTQRIRTPNQTDKRTNKQTDRQTDKQIESTKRWRRR